MSFTYTIETELEDDGRWIAEVPELPGVMVYGSTKAEAVSKVKALALRVIADKVEEDENSSDTMTVSFAGGA
jgi:predicted RNase H-like HicB family nuclease